MRWCKLSFNDANHNPVVIIGNNNSTDVLKRNVKAGKTISIDASSSYDPDGNNIFYNWWIFDECSYSEIKLKNKDKASLNATIHVPDDQSLLIAAQVVGRFRRMHRLNVI